MQTKYQDLSKEPVCRPFDFAGSKEHGVLCIHGFTGSPGGIHPLGERIAKETGYTVKGILLPGHGTTPEDMAAHRWNEWLQAALDGFDALARECKHVSVAGISMGGTLTLLLCQQRPVYRAIPIVAALKVTNPYAKIAFLAWPFNRFLNWSDHPKPDGDFILQYKTGYPCTPLRSVVDLNRLMRLARRDLPQVHCPLLVVRAGKDETVHATSADWIMACVSSQEKCLLELKNSFHMCTLGPEREILFKDAVAFLKK